MVKLLLTSGGVTNASIRDSLVEMLGKPIADCDAPYWMRRSGLANLLPSLSDAVWVGVSAGSMAMTPRVGDLFEQWIPPDDGPTCLGVVDFSIFPHLGHEDMPYNTMEGAERWAAGITGPAYAIDDQTAIKVVDGAVEVISEGTWVRLSA